jgi:malate dehydrogenase
MAVPSDGSYGIDEGLICSVPVRCSGGSYERETGVELDDFAKSKLEITVNELREERESVKKLDLV